MKIFISSIFVDDQEKALQFYTGKLGFEKKQDVEQGGYRWLTVVSPEAREGTQLLLEANSSPAASTYQQAIYAQGVAATMFEVTDLDAEYKRLAELGVEFSMPPQDIGVMKIAQLQDTCGNIIQLNQPV